MFQHDNERVIDFIDKAEISSLLWSQRCPDLNLREHVWAMMKETDLASPANFRSAAR